MSKMSDEQWEFMQDSREKKQTARSARHTRTHCGKGGAVKFPSDYMTKKERDAMNGKCERYRMNDPMTWEQFKAMPNDLKVLYVKALRQKYNVPDKEIAEMFGVKKGTLSSLFTKLGLNKGAGNGKRKWDKVGFYNWLNKNVPEDIEPVEEEIPCDHKRPDVYTDGTEKIVDPDTALAEEQIEAVTVKDDIAIIKEAEEQLRLENERLGNCDNRGAVPNSGTLTFEGGADSIMNSIKDILRNRYVRLNVQWTVVDDRLDSEKTVTIDTSGLAKAATVIDYALMNEARKAKLGTKG